MKKSHIAWLCIIFILFVDQALKIWIKTHFALGEELRIFSWFRLYFLENEGMAFGFSFGKEWGKIILSCCRLIAVGVLIWYLHKLIKENKVGIGFCVCLAFIIAGALGNVLDSIFYGVLFSDSYYHVADFLPEGGGYAPVLMGKVVDMFYFPLFEGHFPSWFPMVGGKHFLFFRPVFNIADSSIFVGVCLMLLTQRKYLLK